MNAKVRVLLIGGALGALIGALAGWIYYQSSVTVDESGQEVVPAPSPAAGVKLGIGLLGLMRMLTGD